jgi:hypothetical protein
MGHMLTSRLPLLALGSALALAACSGGHDDAANTVAANDMAAADAQAAAVAPQDLALPAGDNAVVEDAATAPPIQVVSVPTPAPAASGSEVAPLTDALAAERLIDAGSGIVRVQQRDGWAWLQNGQIIRTASADGRRVSYFHRGDSTPYFVQQDDRGYGYAGGRVTHQYDDHGRVQQPDAQRQREAQQIADTAHRQHDSAEQASRTAPHIDRSRDVRTTTQDDRVAPGSDRGMIGRPDHNQPDQNRPDQNQPDRNQSDRNQADSGHAAAAHGDRRAPADHVSPSPSPSPHGGHQPRDPSTTANRHDRQDGSTTGH